MSAESAAASTAPPAEATKVAETKETAPALEEKKEDQVGEKRKADEEPAVEA